MPSPRTVHEFSHYACGHYTVTATGERQALLPAFASVAHILAPCRACGPPRVERLKQGKVPYDKLP